MVQPIDISFLRQRAVQRRVAVVALAFAAAGAVYAFLAPKWYRSVMTVVPVKPQRASGLSGMLGGDLGGLAASFDASLTGGSDASRIGAVLQSVTVTDALIAKFDLATRYQEKAPDAVRDRALEYCSVRTIAKPNLVQISCEDTDPRIAQEMVAFLGTVGNEAFTRVNASAATEEVATLESRVADLRRQADEASARMREFSERHGIVDLDTQARALVSSVAALEAQRTSRRMDLDYARRFASPDEAGSRALETQLSVLDEQLREMEDPRAQAGAAPSRSGKGGQTSMLPAALRVPQLRADYEKLFRDRKVAEASLVFALDRLEGAKAAQARNVSTFVVLDPPSLPTRKSRPSRMNIILASGLLGVAAGLLWEWMRARRRPA